MAEPSGGLDSSSDPESRELQGTRVRFQGAGKAGTRAPELCRGLTQLGTPGAELGLSRPVCSAPGAAEKEPGGVEW